MSGKRRNNRRGRGAAEPAEGEALVAEAEAPSAPPEPVRAAEPAAASSLPELGGAESDEMPATFAYEAPADPLAEFFVAATERANLGESYVGEIVDSSAQRAQVKELLGFWCADEQYGLDIAEIQEIIKVPVITEVPRSPESVLGVISLRGVIVPIVDLREVLQLEKREVARDSRIVVLRGDGDPVGLLVDRVSHVVRIDAESIEPTPALGAISRADLVTGVGRVGDEILIVLDARSLWTVMDQVAA